MLFEVAAAAVLSWSGGERLPGNPAGDRADRLLIATARRIGASLVTRDERILAYGDSGHLSVIDATP